MSLWRRFTGGLKALFDPASADREVDAELEHYYAESAAELESAGATPAEAQRAVRLRLGERLTAREEARAYGWEHIAGIILGDVRYAARRLRQSPGFTIAAALTLAVGIGASTTIYSAVRPILFEPLPYPDAGRVLMVWDRTSDGARLDVTYGTYRELVGRSRSFAALAVLRSWQPALVIGGTPEQLEAQRVSASYFRALGVAPALGRDFNELDDVVNGPRVVVLSHGLWQRAFGGDRGIVGGQIRLNDEPHTVVGIMPRSFENVSAPAAELWTPLQYDDALPLDGREWGHHLRMIGRLAEHATFSEARLELTRIAVNPLAGYPRVPWALLGQDFLLESLQDATTRTLKPALLVLLGAALLLLAIACGNVTNLLLARAARRRGEMALRAVLGAGRSRMLTQLLVESLLLAGLGGALGLSLTALGTRALLAISPAELPRVHEIRLDVGALVFALGITTAVGVAVGVIPALLASRRSIGGLVRGRSARITGSDGRVRRGLVVAEVVLAVVLLVNGGLLLRSFDRLLAVDPGFDGARVVTMQVQAVGRRYDDDRTTHRFFAEALDAVRGVPGVASAAFTSQLPLSGDLQKYGVHLEARPAPYAEADGSALRYAVTPDYFDAMGIPLLHGRLLEPADDTGSAHVVVVNDRFAQQAFGSVDPLGQRLRLGTADQPWATIVGIVGNVKQSSLDSDSETAIYLPTVQAYFADRALWLVVRARGDAVRLAAIRQAIWSIDKQPVVRVATMSSRIEAATAQRRMMLRIFQLFGTAALLLAAIGVYGVQAGGVAERTNEIGVRSALGATGGTLITLVLREGLALAALGLAIGLLLAASASTMIASLLFGVSRFDLLTYLAVTLLLLAIAAIASTLPAWRAARVDPSTALRAE